MGAKPLEKEQVVHMYIVHTSAYGASPVLVSRASRSAVASFSQLEADVNVTT